MLKITDFYLSQKVFITMSRLFIHDSKKKKKKKKKKNHYLFLFKTKNVSRIHFSFRLYCIRVHHNAHNAHDLLHMQKFVVC